MAEQTPSIGRIVHYMSFGSVGGKYPPATRAAIIVAVGTAGVDLCVLNPEGFFFNRSVPFDPGGAPGSWRWPPRT